MSGAQSTASSLRATTLILINIIGSQINIYTGDGGNDEEKSIRASNDFITSPFEAESSFRNKYAFTGNGNMKGYSGIYECSKGIWIQRNDAHIERDLINILSNLSDLNEAEVKYLNGDRIKSVRESFARQICDSEFEDKLDAHLNLFPMKNKVFDYSTGELRDIRSDDYIKTTTDWVYNAELSAQYKPAVLNSLKTSNPIEEELDTYLRFVASLMQGNRRGKHFFVCTTASPRTSPCGRRTLAIC